MPDSEPHINREPVSFMSGENRLYGVLHRPVGDAVGEKGVVLASAGMKNRTGYARLYVAMADYLAGEGLPTLRFDFHGCGDSDGRHAPTGAHEERHADINEQVLTGRLADDVLTSVAEFKRLTGCGKVLVFGLCSGANSAIYAAEKSREIDSVVLANLPVAIDSSRRREKQKGKMGLYEEQFMFQAYLNKILSPRAWARFLSGQSDFKSIFYLLKRKLVGSKSRSDSQSTDTRSTQGSSQIPDDDFEFNFDMLDKFESYFESGRPAWFFLSENDPIRVNFETYFENGHGAELMQKYDRLCHKIMFKDTNHSFVNTEWRRELFARLAESAGKESTWPSRARQ